MKDGILERDGNFASDLKRLRTQHAMTEQDLAAKLGCTARNIRDYEAGVRRPHPMTVDQINHALLGRDRFGEDAPATRARKTAALVCLKDLSDDVLVAELRRRWHGGN
ncbi:helix-turn-helix transcriptional regulator [Paraburkholderia sp. J69-2]|nr:helix-turn-helix transcriptional regulator [Paraburkholderia sp. J69-2]